MGEFALTLRDVLLIGPHPPPYGGPGVHMLHLRRALEARGARCAALSIWSGGEGAGPDVHRVRTGFEFISRLSGYIRRGFHVHHLFNAESPRGVILAATAAVCVRALGGTFSIGFIGGPRQNLLDRAAFPWSWLLRLALRSARFIVCNNIDVADSLIRRGAPRERLHPIPAFHPEQVADIGSPDPATRRFIEQHDPVLCSIVHPRFETGLPHHEIDLLIDAVAVLSPAHPTLGCVVMGGARFGEHYLQKVTVAGLGAFFHFTGELPHRECLGVMSASTVFVRPYLRDGSSSSVREALALGKLVVASRNPQHPSDAHQFTPNDAGSLAATIEATLAGAAMPARAPADVRVDAKSLERELALFPLVPAGER